MPPKDFVATGSTSPCAIKPVVVNTYEDGQIKWLKTIAPEE